MTLSELWDEAVHWVSESFANALQFGLIGVLTWVSIIIIGIQLSQKLGR